MGDFDDGFNGVLDGLESTFGQGKTFRYANVDYPVVDIGGQERKFQAALGPTFNEMSVSVIVRKSVLAAAGVVNGNSITVNGKKVKILGQMDDGDDAVTLACGNPGVRVGG